MIGIASLTIYIFLVHIPCHLVQAQKRGNVKTDITVYENIDGSGESASYYDNPGWWEDMQEVIEDQGLSGIQLICVQAGVFILYHESHHVIDIENAENEVSILAGVNTCIDPPPMGVGSIRHASSKVLNFENMTYVTLFGEVYYSGNMHTVTKKSGKNIAYAQPTQSIIIFGADRWLFKNKAGDLFCVVPYQPIDNEEDNQEQKIYVCIVPNTTDIFNKGNSYELDSDFVMVRKNCEDGGEDVIQVNITTCFDYRGGELQKPAVGDILNLPPIKPMTNDSGVEFSPFYGVKCSNEPNSSVSVIAMLIRIRVTTDFLDAYQFLLPFNKEYIWRTELLDSTFEVMTKLLGTIIPEWFLGSVREFYIYFAEQNWELFKDIFPKNETRDIREALYETRWCHEMVGSWDTLEKIQEKVKDVIQSGPIDETSLIKPELAMLQSLDALTEFVWLSINIVGATCHQILGHETNFWLDYLTVANDLYLSPMVGWWTTSNFEHFYHIVFGGVNFTRQYQAAAVFATEAYDLMKYTEVWRRPEQVKTDDVMGIRPNMTR